MNLAGILRQVNRCLSGRIATANHDHIVFPAQLGLNVRSSVINSLAFKLLQVLDLRLVVLRAAGNDDAAGANSLAAIHAQLVRTALAIQLRYVVRDQNLRAKLLCLRGGATRQLLAGDSHWEAQIIFDLRA